MHMHPNLNGMPVSGRGALAVLAATLAMAAGFGGLGLITAFAAAPLISFARKVIAPRPSSRAPSLANREEMSSIAAPSSSPAVDQDAFVVANAPQRRMGDGISGNGVDNTDCSGRHHQQSSFETDHGYLLVVPTLS